VRYRPLGERPGCLSSGGAAVANNGGPTATGSGPLRPGLQPHSRVLRRPLGIHFRSGRLGAASRGREVLCNGQRLRAISPYPAVLTPAVAAGPLALESVRCGSLGGSSTDDGDLLVIDQSTSGCRCCRRVGTCDATSALRLPGAPLWRPGFRASSQAPCIAPLGRASLRAAGLRAARSGHPGLAQCPSCARAMPASWPQVFNRAPDSGPGCCHIKPGFSPLDPTPRSGA